MTLFPEIQTHVITMIRVNKATDNMYLKNIKRVNGITVIFNTNINRFK